MAVRENRIVALMVIERFLNRFTIWAVLPEKMPFSLAGNGVLAMAQGYFSAHVLHENKKTLPVAI